MRNTTSESKRIPVAQRNYWRRSLNVVSIVDQGWKEQKQTNMTYRAARIAYCARVVGIVLFDGGNGASAGVGLLGFAAVEAFGVRELLNHVSCNA